MGKRPLGVTIVALLTIMSAIAIGYYQLVLYALSAVGGPPILGADYGLPLWALVPGFLVIFALFVAVGQLRGTKLTWYASMSYWLLILVYFGWLAYMIDFSQGIIWLDRWGYFVSYGFEEFLLTMTPLIYSLGCLLYFLTKTPRDFFDLKIHLQSNLPASIHR